MSLSDDAVTLTVGRAEALLLFEVLAGVEGHSVFAISGRAERLAFVRLHGALESTLVEPFMPDYKSMVEEARLKLERESSSGA